MAFPSVYEMFVEDLTTVRKQHFWEYFSGATLNSRWAFTSLVGGGNTTGAMADEVNGGYKITTSVSSSAQGALAFGNASSVIKPFSPTGSVFIMKFKPTTTSSSAWSPLAGFCTHADILGTGREYALLNNSTSSAKIIASCTSSGGGFKSANTTVDSTNTDEMLWKIEMKSSTIDYSINGVFSNTISGHGLVEGLTPNVSARSDGAGTFPTVNVQYVECYNT